MIGIVCAFFHTEGKGFYSKGASIRLSEELDLGHSFWVLEVGGTHRVGRYWER